jgi:16S rRNA (uracil1498-N3)-methyltransferase
VAHLRSNSNVSSHRFFVPGASHDLPRVTFSAEQAKQISKVLRLKPDDTVIAFDGSGDELLVRLTGIGRSTVGEVMKRCVNRAEPTLTLTLYQGLLKGTKLEFVLQKCTEIGVSRFVPVVSERAVPAEPSEARQSRFRTIVREAAEQSGRSRVPEIVAPVSLPEALAKAMSEGPVLFAWEEAHDGGIANAEPFETVKRASLFVGPEGGFTAVEAGQARDAGAMIVSLGPRILRAETAAMVGAALVLFHAGDLT